MSLLVLDTNIVLDLFVFNDANATKLKAALQAGAQQWIATQPMRDELVRVLDYPHIAGKLAFYKMDAAVVLAQFDQLARLVPVAPKAAVTCKDPDDQKFIDLAVEQLAMLLSKDKAVLCMEKRLLALSVVTKTTI